MDILEKIIEVKKEEIQKLKNQFSASSFENFELFHQINYKFSEHVKASKNIEIIAEVKKASPSKGIIREDFNHIEIAKTYMNANVAAISVLTDEQFFQGSINFLNDIAQIKTVPLLRKDFIIDEFQILEAKANGADIILLIAEALDKEQIKDLTITATEFGLETLLEFHSHDQIEKIDFGTNKIIGINNRDLKTFNVDLQNTILGLKEIPEDIIVISESGINSEESLTTVKSTRTNAVLVGEHFMRQENISESLNIFKQWCQRES